jgi:hypothetical protein
MKASLWSPRHHIEPSSVAHTGSGEFGGWIHASNERRTKTGDPLEPSRDWPSTTYASTNTVGPPCVGSHELTAIRSPQGANTPAVKAERDSSTRVPVPLHFFCGQRPTSRQQLCSTSWRATRLGSCGCCVQAITTGQPRTGRLSSTSAPSSPNMMVVGRARKGELGHDRVSKVSHNHLRFWAGSQGE